MLVHRPRHIHGDFYEYIFVYVDGLIIGTKDPEGFFAALQTEPINFTLKGVGPAIYHLGGDLF